MVPLIVLIVVLVAGGGIALLVRSRHSAAAASDEAGSGPNEFLQSPPTSFPSSADDDDEDEDDEVVVARFQAPGARSAGAAEATRSPVTPPVYHLEAEPAEVTEVEVEVEVEEMAGPVIDLSGDDEAWEDVVLQPEPDAVDHVLEALINRARFKQVEVEAVATELVERADLQGQEVSEVLAELVGRADDSTLDAARTSELTLFNDEVPSRPGQLTDFARLAPAEKKRIIVRVLCLLVARSEDQQLPPRAEGDAAETRSWPLARAVWPLASADDDAESQLPSRRLAKSG
jgi:hypothetical protein